MVKKLLLAFLLILVLFIAQPSYASDFSQLYVRFDRLKAASAISATVCAKPSAGNAGNEGKVSIIFPQSFTISADENNWNSDTAASNIPEDGEAWPGVSTTAQAVVGHTVTFTTSDLTSSSTLYCFHVSSSLSNVGGAADSTGTITTKTAGNAQIDSDEYGVSVISNDQITVTATAPASPSDFQATIIKTSPTDISNHTPNTVITYRITYGSYLASSSNLTLVAEWDQGTIAGAGSPSVDIVDYVTSSASNGYNGATPVIDLSNNKITWTLNSFPANTSNQTVTFQLKTNASYTGSSLVSWPTTARVLGPGTQSADSSIDLSYQYPQATPTNTPGATNTPTAGPSTTPIITTITPTPSSAQISIISVNLNSISSSKATVTVATNKSSQVTLSYGKSASQLTKTGVSESAFEHSFSIENLSPQTEYFFQAVAEDSSGNKATSDIYTLTTAKIGPVPVAQIETLIISSQNVILAAPSALNIEELTNKSVAQTAIVPQGTNYSFRFSVGKSQLIKSVKAYLRLKTKKKNARILGASTFSQATDKKVGLNNVSLTEVEPGVFAGQMNSDTAPGDYELVVVISDYNGNISEQLLADIKISNRFKVMSVNKSPIEHARIQLYLFNPTLKIYENISPQILPIQNPFFTDPFGESQIVLPPGQYKAEVDSLGFKKKTIEFTIDSSTTYPEITLENAPFSLIVVGQYYLESAKDVALFTSNAIVSFVIFGRFYTITSAFIVLSFVILSFLSLAAKFHLNVLSIPRILTHHLYNKSKLLSPYATGVIVDDKNHKPVRLAQVFLIDVGTTNIFANAKTDIHGLFVADLHGRESCLISIYRTGFQPLLKIPYVHGDDLQKKPLVITRESSLTIHPLYSLIEIWKGMFGFTTEALIVMSLILEFFFINRFGIMSTAPFIFLSIINILLYVFYSRAGISLQYRHR